LVLTQDTTQLEGWFDTRGEWILFPTQGLERGYNPYPEEESERCVSVVNGTGEPRESFDRLAGSLVVVDGVAKRYEDFPLGETSVDRLMSRRYFEGERVVGSCVREFVFLATAVRPR
jgi:hypothetical protein